jgi:hypothetical protein
MIIGQVETGNMMDLMYATAALSAASRQDGGGMQSILTNRYLAEHSANEDDRSGTVSHFLVLELS